MGRPRNFKAEYKRRIANAAKRGLSRSQARGHAKRGESTLRPAREIDTARLEAALRVMRQTGSQSAAAKELKISGERFRRFIRENSLAQRSGRKWTFSDRPGRWMTVISDGQILWLNLPKFDQSSLNGEHLNAIKAFLPSNDIELLQPFVGRSVIDAKGKAHLLETDPNKLHRLAAAGSEVFHQVYRLTN